MLTARRGRSYSLESGPAMLSSERISASIPNPASATAAASISNAAKMYPPASAQGEPVSMRWPNSTGAKVPPLVAAIALGLIWMGAARMPASAKSRYATAGVLSAVLIGWVAVAQYFGAANTYFATADTAEAGVPTILFGLLIPLAVAAIALWRSESIARLVSAIPLHW